MQMRKPFRLAALAPVLALALGVSVSNAAEEEDAFLAADTLSSEQLTFISKSGAQVVAHLDKARAALDRNELGRARFETGKARAILGQVREKSPALRLHDRIAAALKELRSGGKPKAETLLPIYAELDASVNVGDADDIRAYVDKAKGGIGAGQVDVAEDNLLEATARIRYTEIDLPIEESYSGLTRALIQLDRKQSMTAKSTLGDVERGIQGFTVIASKTIEEETSAVSAGPE